MPIMAAILEKPMPDADTQKKIEMPQLPGPRGLGYALALGMVSGLTALGYHLTSLFSETDIIMLFLVGAVITAAFCGRGPAILYSFASVSAFNYFFVPPTFTFNVYNPSYWLTFAVMFFACLVISTLAARLRDEAFLSRRREHEALMLYHLMKELADANTREAMSESLLRWIDEVVTGNACIRYPDGAMFGDTIAMPETARVEFPITGTARLLGTVSIAPAHPLLPDQMIMMKTFVGLLGSALERAETAQAAEQAKILAEKEKMRNILLSSVSHDLRSPLAAITGAADTLLQEKPGNRLLGSIRQEAARLARIVGNLLDITRIEGGQLKLNMSAYDPAEIIGSAVESCRDMLKEYKLSLQVPALPFVRMDGLLISQVIQNLLENVVRHTPPGTAIEVAADLYDGGLRLSVSDSGPGIPQGREKDIFSKFATYGQGDRPKGAGLGLAICQAIITAHQGSIHAKNRPEGGCRITVELPASLTMPSEEAAHAG